jgi:membrane-bound serine protease (ClpP class)
MSTPATSSPSVSAVAVLGILMVIASLTMALVNMKSVPFEVTWQLGWVTRALAMVFGSLLGTAVAMYFVSRALPSTRFGKPLILTHANTARAGDGDSLIGKHGVTETALRPSGKASIGGKRVDVITDGGFVEANQRVVVVEAQGPRVVVRKA